MSDENKYIEEDDLSVDVEQESQHKFDNLTGEESKTKLMGMFREWFLDYASYVILERAVPQLEDGLKPVQRRILHSMKRIDDGRFNKVANIIGSTMQFHPHGDSSIGGALVQLGQKDLLVECQGNWGNILTGDSAAAPRYIEARLSKFALDVVFNPKTTEWTSSYDGRNEEPVTLPVKFPLLLAQGGEGIAVGLASKILPHNFNELLDASIAYLRGEEFELYPDFPTGGLADCSKYNDGLRGGAVKVRARIIKDDKRTLKIVEIPFGETTESIIESIIKANNKGKIKIKRVDDNTAAGAEIVISLTNDVSPDKTIDALYAFTNCEVSISPNSCVIWQDKPHFMGVSEILKHSANQTRDLLRRELEIELSELNEQWHNISLEKIFIENRIYHKIEECKSWEEVLETIDRELAPFKSQLRREITTDDIIRLTEIKIKRISKYNTFKAEEQIRGIDEQIAAVQHNIEYVTDYTIDYFTRIKEKYGKNRTRQTELRSFDTIEAAKVVVANAKLYVDKKEGFFGIGPQMKQMENAEFVCDCSDIDEVIAFTKSGKYIITKVSGKAYFDKDIYYIGIFKKNDDRTIYNILYRDGKNGSIMVKRCAIKGITRDKVYDITKGTPHSEILYMSVNHNGEAEVLKVYFKPRPRLKKVIVDLDFSTLAIKGRQSQGNLFSRYGIHKVQVKEAGVSTLGGMNIWFDPDIRRLNTDGRGELLGEFKGNDKILIVTKSGRYYTTGFDQSQHFPEDMLIIRRHTPGAVYSVTYFDAEQDYFYVKRFICELSDKFICFIDENPNSYMVEFNDDIFPQLEVTYGGKYSTRPTELIDVEEFIGVKGVKAKGKRVTTYETKSIRFVEPLVKELPEDEPQEIVASNEIAANEIVEEEHNMVQQELF